MPGETLTIIIRQGGRWQTSDYNSQNRNYSYGGGTSGGRSGYSGGLTSATNTVGNSKTSDGVSGGVSYSPPNSGSSYYSSRVGVGLYSTASGGHGRVVIVY